MIRPLLALTALASLLCGGALAETRIEAGTLTCQGRENTAFGVGSVQELDCTFRPILGPEQKYAAVIRRAGLDLGKSKRSVLGWMILAPTREVRDGELAGNYAGVSAGATVGLGAGANVLLGGSNSSFALQPVSVEGDVGLNITASITGLELRRRP